MNKKSTDKSTSKYIGVYSDGKWKMESIYKS